METVLIVENHPAMSHWLARVVHQCHPKARIVMLNGGPDLYAAVDYYRPDLVFMDVRLAGLNGLEATRVLKSRGFRAPIVILTNSGLPEYRQAALECGAARCLVNGDVRESDIVDILFDVDLNDSAPFDEHRPEDDAATRSLRQPGTSLPVSYYTSDAADE